VRPRGPGRSADRASVAASQAPLEQALRVALPRGAVRTGELCRGVYGRDASFYDYRPRAVVRVASVAEVQRLLAVVRAEGVPVTFRAAGTSLCRQTLGTGVVAELRLAWMRVEVRDDGAAVWCEPDRRGDRLAVGGDGRPGADETAA
jgi:D-lactate dehydrogenase